MGKLDKVIDLNVGDIIFTLRYNSHRIKRDYNIHRPDYRDLETVICIEKYTWFTKHDRLLVTVLKANGIVYEYQLKSVSRFN